MKEEIGILIRNYFEGELDAASLDEAITARLPVQSRKRGQSLWLPSGEPLHGMKFEHAELSRLHCDLKSKKIGVESALLIVDMITMYRDIIVRSGSIFIDEIDGIGTPDDLEVWRKEMPLSKKLS